MIISEYNKKITSFLHAGAKRWKFLRKRTFQGKGDFPKLQSYLEKYQLQEIQQNKVGNTPTCDFDIKNVKLESHHMTNASFHTYTMLSMLRSLDPYWESQLMMEYSKDLFTCKVLEEQEMNGKYKVVMESFIFMIRSTYLKVPSSRKNYLTQPMRSFFQIPLDSLKHIILS